MHISITELLDVVVGRLVFVFVLFYRFSLRLRWVEWGDRSLSCPSYEI